MCRHCAHSCKINSCIFKRDANESAWWTGLLAWNLITSAVPFANEFTFPLCLSLSFFILLSFTLYVPCNPLCRSMSWIRNLWRDSLRRKKKKILPFQTPISYFIQQSGCCLQKEKDTKRSTYTGFGCLFRLIFLLLLLMFSRNFKWRFFISLQHDSPWPRDSEDGLSTTLPPSPLILFPGDGWYEPWPSFSKALIPCACSLPRSDQN